MAVNAPRVFWLYQTPQPRRWRDISFRQRDGAERLTHQEKTMNQFIRAGATIVAIFSSVGFAAAQNASNHPDLTPPQQRTLSQGLANSPSQSAPAAAQSLPSDVTDQVPEAKNLLFVKLPDRVLLIDPDNKVVTELVMDSGASSDTTTGSNSGSSDRPSR
jgi:hypothetical protein